MNWQDQLDLFQHRCSIPLRYSDIDMLQHVNNARFLSFIEDARVDYLKKVGSWDGRAETLGIILARVELDFKEPIFITDSILVCSRVSRIGNKSFDMEYLITKCDSEQRPNSLAGYARAVLVAFDVPTGRSITIPAALAERIRAFEVTELA
jgi:acyl-CoA thioester hydrolase